MMRRVAEGALRMSLLFLTLALLDLLWLGVPAELGGLMWVVVGINLLTATLSGMVLYADVRRENRTRVDRTKGVLEILETCEDDPHAEAKERPALDAENDDKER